MRKKNRTILAAFAIMISCSLLGVTVAAGQAEGMLGDGTEISGNSETEETESTDAAEKMSGMDEQDGAPEKSDVGGNIGSESSGGREAMPGTESSGTVTETPGSVSDSDGKEGISGTEYPGATEIPEVTNSPDALEESMETTTRISEAAANPEGAILSLQIPERLGVVIDPWEIAGKGQIYSEQFTIRNTGETSGVLTLSFMCRRGEGSTAIIRTDNLGLHDDESKSIYIEMIFGDADRMVLTEAGLEYQTELQPGEEMTVSFVGEVNEYASESWGSGDVEIEGVYLWDIAEGAGAEAQSDVNGIEEALASEADGAEGIGGENAIDGNVLPGNDSAEGTDSSVEDEPAESSEGQDGDAKEGSEGEPQDGGEQNSSCEASDGNGTKQTDDPKCEIDSADSAEGEENSSLSSGEDGETGSEQSEGLSAPKDIDVKDGAEINSDGGEDSLPMEDVGGEAEPGNIEEDPQQETEDADITGTDSQETGRNPEIDDAEDGWEG